MSNAKKCDRCGKLYERYIGVEINEGGHKYNAITIQNDSIHRLYDLCPECMKSSIKWLKEVDE